MLQRIKGNVWLLLFVIENAQTLGKWEMQHVEPSDAIVPLMYVIIIIIIIIIN